MHNYTSGSSSGLIPLDPCHYKYCNLWKEKYYNLWKQKYWCSTDTNTIGHSCWKANFTSGPSNEPMPRQNQLSLIATKIQMFQWKYVGLLWVLLETLRQNLYIIHFLQFWCTFVVHIKSKQRLEYDHRCQNFELILIRCRASMIPGPL